VNAVALRERRAELREADRPPETRGLARDHVLLMAAYRETGVLEHAHFTELPDLLAPGDVLVLNTSRTLPAALPARDGSGARAMLHLSTPAPDGGTTAARSRWIVELRSPEGGRRRGHAGQRLELPAGGRAKLLAPYLAGRLWVAQLDAPAPLLEYLDDHGRPIRYRHLADDPPLSDLQNVYAREPGSAEMPSAGRPFTPELITALVARGVDVAPLVLHTGVSSLERGERPYPERFEVPAFTAARVNLARELGGRVVAVGTTVVRALESAAGEGGRIHPSGGWTDLVISAERPVRSVDGVLTGFHDSDSSHLELLAAIAGRRLLREAYAAARANGYMRHEFGDVLLVLPARA